MILCLNLFTAMLIKAALVCQLEGVHVIYHTGCSMKEPLPSDACC